MRWHILKTLLHKEALRHATNRGGLALAGLLVAAALLLAALNPAGNKKTSLVGGVHHCYVHYEGDSAWVEHLKKSVPPELSRHMLFRNFDPPIRPEQSVLYPTGTGAIQIRRNREGQYLVWLWHPSGDRNEMAVYESWFWRETHRYFRDRAAESLKAAGIDPERELPPQDLDRDDLWPQRLAHAHLRQEVAEIARARPDATQLAEAIPEVEFKESPLVGSALDSHAAIATALVMFALFFTCVYLMPSLTCEERERGLLLAQALSPATAMEILTAKFFFYPTFGILLATLLAGIHSPATLARPFFWLAIGTLAAGSLGIGMSIASLARTQRASSMAALCYMLAVALILLICQHNNIAFLPYLAIEYHAPNLLHATLTDQVRPHHWYNLAASAALAVAWLAAAVILFRKRGWQ